MRGDVLRKNDLQHLDISRTAECVALYPGRLLHGGLPTIYSRDGTNNFGAALVPLVAPI